MNFEVYVSERSNKDLYTLTNQIGWSKEISQRRLRFLRTVRQHCHRLDYLRTENMVTKLNKITIFTVKYIIIAALNSPDRVVFAISLAI